MPKSGNFWTHRRGQMTSEKKVTSCFLKLVTFGYKVTRWSQDGGQLVTSFFSLFSYTYLKKVTRLQDNKGVQRFREKIKISNKINRGENVYSVFVKNTGELNQLVTFCPFATPLAAMPITAHTAGDVPSKGNLVPRRGGGFRNAINGNLTVWYLITPQAGMEAAL